MAAGAATSWSTGCWRNADRHPAPSAGLALGRVAQLDGRHDVQRPVDLPVAGAGEPMADLVAGGGVERRRAVPGCEVALGREAGDVTDVDEQPGRAGRADAVERQQRGAGRLDVLAQFLVGGLLPRVGLLGVGMSSAATPRRTSPAASRGVTVASRAFACAADRSFFAPPGMSSSSRWCSCAIMRVWSSPSTRRRSARMRSTASCGSSTTGRRPVMRVPTRATEWASVASVLRPCPVEKTRTRRAPSLRS
jgi:hypothetical protein